MTRSQHQKKEIEEALRHAETHGWRVEQGGSHAWGRIYCPYNAAECRCGEFCITSVWSTPKNAMNHARAEIAETTMQVNLTKEAQRLTPRAQRELRSLVK